MSAQEPWNFPARAFEAATGLAGIRGGWILPGWVDGCDRQKIFGLGTPMLQRIWAWLVKRNPTLPAEPTILRDSVFGVLSDFNLNDIRFWCDRSSERDRTLDRESRVHSKCGLMPYWRLSAETFDLIMRKLATKPARVKREKVRPSPTARAVEEWVGRHPDSEPPPHVVRRIFDSHGGRCHISRREIRPGDTWQLEHIKPLRAGGLNRETNLAPALVEPHREKTKRERSLGAKADRARNKHLGLRHSRNALPGSRHSRWKRKVSGEVVLR